MGWRIRRLVRRRWRCYRCSWKGRDQMGHFDVTGHLAYRRCV